MATRAGRERDFLDLLSESREVMWLHLVGRLPDLADPATEAHLTPEESLVYAQMREGAAQTRAELFAAGAEHGLTKREITIALLRPLAWILRSSLLPDGCYCLRCRARRSPVGGRTI